MDLEQLLNEFRYEDLRWFAPVLAGLLIIAGALIIGLLRGITSGVIAALVFGGLMSTTIILIDALEGRNAPAAADNGAADLARAAARLADTNSEALVDLSRVIQSLRTTLDGVTPLFDAEDPADADRFSDSLADAAERLDTAVDTLTEAGALRERLQQDLEAVDAELEERDGVTVQ